MSVSYEDFIKKYKLDDFRTGLELKGYDKVNFYNELNAIMKSFCKILDKLTNIVSLRGGQVIIGLAKLQAQNSVVNKTDIKNCLNIDRLEKLMHAFEYLEQQDYISVEKKTQKFHILKLNEKNNPDFKLLSEIVQRFWTSPEEDKKKVQKWRDSI